MLPSICLALLLCSARGSADSTVAFVDVTVIPMDRERSLPHSTVLVQGNRIVKLGPAKEVTVPAGAVRVDGRGKFLIPGLAEMHAHIPGGQASSIVMQQTLFLYVSGGITTIRGMLGHPRHLQLRAQAANPNVISPWIYTSGPSFNGNTVPTVQSALTRVAEQKEAGYDFIKIHPGIKREVFDSLSAAAQRAGLRLAGHVPLEVGLQRALEVPYASIDHLDGYVEAMVRADSPVSSSESQLFGLNLGEHLDESRIPSLVKATKEAGVWNVPTQTLMENLAPGVSAEALARRPEMRFVSPDMLAEWAQEKGSILSETGSSAESARRTLAVRRKLIRALHAGGAGLLLGSDAPQIYNVPGYSIHRELEAVVAAGLTPYQALETGTRNVAIYFGTLAESGTIEEGKRADLVLLEGNPLSDIRNTSRRAGVMLHGRWLSKDAIESRLAAIAEAVRN
ncbi:MAG TPA: amidohydrolase family protein [Gemmatimonadales bacterium]|nr:amidohydrolase family protein [Gemmatimonadales bacterium]